MEISEQLRGGLLVIYRPYVSGPIIHTFLMGPVVVYGEFFLLLMTYHQLTSTWTDWSRENTVTSCFVTLPIYAGSVTDTNPGHSDTEGFPRCSASYKISYESEAMTDMGHRNTLEM